MICLALAKWIASPGPDSSSKHIFYSDLSGSLPYWSREQETPRFLPYRQGILHSWPELHYMSWEDITYQLVLDSLLFESVASGPFRAWWWALRLNPLRRPSATSQESPYYWGWVHQSRLSVQSIIIRWSTGIAHPSPRWKCGDYTMKALFRGIFACKYGGGWVLVLYIGLRSRIIGTMLQECAYND